MKKASGKAIKMSASKKSIKDDTKMAGKEMSFIEKMQAAKKAKKK